MYLAARSVIESQLSHPRLAAVLDDAPPDKLSENGVPLWDLDRIRAILRGEPDPITSKAMLVGKTILGVPPSSRFDVSRD